jgi:hypothetical protein
VRYGPCSESVDACLQIAMAGAEDDGREGPLIHGIRIALRFKTKARTLTIVAAVLARDPSKHVARVELEGWLGREDF